MILVASVAQLEKNAQPFGLHTCGCCFPRADCSRPSLPFFPRRRVVAFFGVSPGEAKHRLGKDGRSPTGALRAPWDRRMFSYSELGMRSRRCAPVTCHLWMVDLLTSVPLQLSAREAPNRSTGRKLPDGQRELGTCRPCTSSKVRWDLVVLVIWAWVDTNGIPFWGR